jgi:hypothetical protein
MADASRADVLAVRATARWEQSVPIVAAIRTWAHQQRALPDSSLGKSIAYMLGLWPGLTRFLDDPRIALDNNATERGLRGIVIGRKNHYGPRVHARHRGRRTFLQPHRIGRSSAASSPRLTCSTRRGRHSRPAARSRSRTRS